MKLYISTSIKSGETTNGEELIDRVCRLGADGVELDYRITPEMVPSLKSALRRNESTVSSVHNFFPAPPIRPHRPGSGDFFNLASTDADERNQAIRWTARTIEWASEFEARAVVLHCGKVDIDPALDTIKTAHEKGTLETEAARLMIAEKLTELEAKKPPHFDALLFVMDRLIRVAEREKVMLALENRNHYHELPGPDDFRQIFAEFEGAPIGYWHDTGHDHVMTALKFCPSGKMLTTYGNNLVGMHIHDALGIKDHLPPGSGEIDFAQAAFYMKPPVTGVLELKPGTSDSAAEEGISWFRRHLSVIDIP